MSEQRIIVTELEYVTTTKDEYDALRAEVAELKRQLAELEAQLAQANEMFGQLEMNNVDVRMYATKLEAALLIYADMTNWSVRSLLPEDYAEPDEWIGPEIPGYAIARHALERKP